MKWFAAVFMVVAGLCASSRATSITTGGIIDSAITWSADTVKCSSAVIIDSGVTLTIDPGTVVEFQGYYRLSVQGRLLAVGTPADSITFTGIIDSGRWHGIRFDTISAVNDTSRLAYCVIRDGLANGSSFDGMGGGMFVNSFSKLVISHCSFRGNRANGDRGGAMYLVSADVDIENTTFTGNRSSGSFPYGGAVYCYQSAARITDCAFTGNSSSNGGGIYCYYSDETVITRTTFSGNSGSGVGLYRSDAVLTNCTVTGNSGYNGGGLSVRESTPYIYNCRITDNYASSSSGGVYTYAGSPHIIGSVIANNRSRSVGGVMFSVSSNGSLRNTTVANNSGWGVSCGSRNVTVTNCAIWGNTVDGEPKQVLLDGDYGYADILYCTVQGGFGAIEGASSGIHYQGTYLGNLDLYPVFTDSANGDYSLSSASPCINTGTPDTAGLGLPATDLAGASRIHAGTVARIDIGAYEYAGDPPAYLTLTRPAGAESFTAGTMEELTWTSVGTVPAVAIAFSADNGASWTAVTDSTANDGSFDWLVPDAISSSCLIRVMKSPDGYPLDENGSGFSITSGLLSLTSPDDGSALWEAGSTQDITWNGDVSISAVSIAYSLDAGTTWTSVTDSTPNDGTHAWTLPDTVSDACLIKISEQGGGIPADISDGTFDIHRGTVTAAGHIGANTVWDVDTVRVTGELTVLDGITLTVEPGTYVEFLGHYPLHVMGRVLAAGTETDSIVFTARDTTGGWHGIRYRNTPDGNDTSKFAYCRFTYGRADGGGGVLFMEGFSKVAVSHSLFAHNSAAGGGGAVFLGYPGANPRFTNCIFRRNRAATGGAIHSYYSRPVLVNVEVSSNYASGDGGGIYAYRSASLKMANGTVVNNTAGDEGGGIYIDWASSPQFTNTVLWGNTAGTSGPQAHLDGTDDRPVFRNCAVEGGEAAFGKGAAGTYTYTYENNVEADPLFTDTEAGDFSLLLGSPCIDAGTTAVTGILLPVIDLANSPRIIGGCIDIGAYESLVNPPPRLISASVDTAYEAVPFNYVALWVDPGDTAVVSYADYPSWLTVSGDTIAGIPGQGDGDTSFMVIASDGESDDTLVVVLAVIPVNYPPVITSAAADTAIEDIPFTYAAEVLDSGDVPVVSFENVPAWLTVSGDTVSGTPLEGEGDTSFTVIASDGEYADTLVVQLTVLPVNDPPVITSTALDTATENALFSYIATAADPDDTPAITFEAYPSWLTVSGDTISGTPVVGTADTSFMVIASDGELADTVTVMLYIERVNSISGYGPGFAGDRFIPGCSYDLQGRLIPDGAARQYRGVSITIDADGNVVKKLRLE